MASARAKPGGEVANGASDGVESVALNPKHVRLHGRKESLGQHCVARDQVRAAQANRSRAQGFLHAQEIFRDFEKRLPPPNSKAFASGVQLGCQSSDAAAQSPLQELTACLRMQPLACSLRLAFPRRPPRNGSQSVFEERVQEMLRAWHLQRQGIQATIHAITVAGTRAQGRDVNHVGQAELSAHVAKALANGRVCALQRILAWTVFQPYLMNVCLHLILEARASVTKRDKRKTALVHSRRGGEPVIADHRENAFDRSKDLDALLWRSVVRQIAKDLPCLSCPVPPTT